MRRVGECTSTVLLQPKLDEHWWADGIECCYLRNILDLLGDGNTYQRRFGEHFAGPIIPIRAKVQSHPHPAKDKARLHQFVPRIFMGYAPYAGANWKRDMLVADAEELQ